VTKGRGKLLSKPGKKERTTEGRKILTFRRGPWRRHITGGKRDILEGERPCRIYSRERKGGQERETVLSPEKKKEWGA